MSFDVEIAGGLARGREGRPPVTDWRTQSISTEVVGNWWALATRGVVSVAFGVAALAWTGITVVGLAGLVSIYLLTSGAFALIGGSDGHSWPMMLEGAVDIFAGIILLGWTGISSLTPMLFVAGWAVTVGAVQIWGAFLMSEPVARGWPLMLTGIASMVFAIVIVAYKWVELSARFAVMGEYAVFSGVLALVMAAGMIARTFASWREARMTTTHWLEP
jgi:uncharacterized membrane protein HdeD (DUF308 family)